MDDIRMTVYLAWGYLKMLQQYISSFPLKLKVMYTSGCFPPLFLSLDGTLMNARGYLCADPLISPAAAYGSKVFSQDC